MPRLSPRNIFRFTIIIIWMVLFGLLLQRDYFVKTLDLSQAQLIKRAKDVSFLGIYFKEERIGYVKSQMIRSETGEYTLFQSAFLILNILEESHPVRMRVEADLTSEQILKNFTFHLSSPFYQMEAHGTVVGNEVHFSLSSGKEPITDIIKLDKPPFLSTNQRGYLLNQGLKEDDKIKVPYFDPISLSGKNTIVQYKGKKKILIHGRIYNLHHFVESFAGIEINSWIDDDGKLMEEESPAGFLFLSEPEFKATDVNIKGQEILSAVSVPIESGTLPAELDTVNSIRYQLSLPEGVDFDLDKDRQTFTNDILTIVREELPAAETAGCTGNETDLASTPYVQSKNAAITALALSVTEAIASPLGKVQALADWVYENIEKRPVLGIPDAFTTLQTRMGDCNEHAALFAALSRSVEIPTRIAAGVMFFNDAFYYHAWNEVCIDNRWISLDTTRNQLPADITHIKFLDGEFQDMVKIGSLIGKLKISVLPDHGSETRNPEP